MDRVWTANPSVTPPSPPTLLTGYPQGSGAGNTAPGPWWYHMITEELRAILVAAGLTPDGTSLAQVAAAIPILAQAAVRAAANVFTKSQTVTPVSLTDAASIATDASQSNTFRVTLGGNRTLANPTNLSDGVILNWKVKQDGTGSRTLAYGSKFKWAGGTAPTLTTTANATDYITAQYHSDDDILVGGIVKGLA